jgi:very-short-patch-repair endonuclease
LGIGGLQSNRFWNNDVLKNIEDVILAIVHAMKDGKV